MEAAIVGRRSQEAEAARVPSIIPIEFWTDSEDDGKGNMMPVDFVKWVKKENPGQITEDKVRRVQKHNPAVWGVIEPYYAAWQKGHNLPEGHTSLDVLAFITKRQAQQLRMLYIMSAEDLAKCTDAGLEKVGMGARDLRDKAVEFLKHKSGAGKSAGETVALQRKMEKMEVRLEELEAENAKLSAKAGVPKRQKPGAFKDEGAKEAA